VTETQPIDPGRQAILEALERHGVRYVVIGGAAAQARGWSEPTDDIDVTPERSEANLARLVNALHELDAGFRVDPDRYPDGFRPPGGFDSRTFRSQVSVAFTCGHGDFDVVLIPDGTTGYEEIVQAATQETLPGTRIVVAVASADTILHSKATADRAKDRAVLDRMRRVLLRSDDTAPDAG
jgi:predicted nucleotidyltransferase